MKHLIYKWALKFILRQHVEWLACDSGKRGIQLNLIGENLIGATFSGSMLHGAKFIGARMHECDFTRADLLRANFSHCKAYDANFHGTFTNATGNPKKEKMLDQMTTTADPSLPDGVALRFSPTHNPFITEEMTHDPNDPRCSELPLPPR